MATATLRASLPGHYWLGAAVLGVVGTAGRAYWAVHHGTVLEGNGCEYARIANNLLRHGTYVGLFEGPELMFPPLYPLLLAIGALLLGSLDHAVRLVPFAAGVLLIPAAFALGQAVYGPRVGLTFAALVALHPRLIDLSSTAYSEGVYLPLMLGGLYWGLQGLKSGQRRPTVLCGVAFGLASLTRPEALFYPLAILGGGLISDLGRPSPLLRTARRGLYLLSPMILLLAPYGAFLSFHTGSLQVEGKGLMNYTIGERMNTGMSPAEASLGIGPDLSELGPQLSPNHFVMIARRSPSLREVATYWVASARRNKVALEHGLYSPAFGSFLGIGLVALGVLGRPWSRWRFVGESVLLTIALGHVFLLLGIHFVLPRYMLPFLLIWLLWIAKGIDEVAWWTLGTVRRTLSHRRRARPWLAASVRAALVAMTLSLGILGVRWGSLQDRGPEPELLRDVGNWLAKHRPGLKRIMTLHPEIPYYSGATFLPLPYADASLGLRYVEEKHPDVVVLTGMASATLPYLRRWLNDGIPAASARLIYRAGQAGPDAVAIYEWRPDLSDPPER